MQVTTKQTYKYFFSFIIKKWKALAMLFVSMTLAVVFEIYVPFFYKDFFDIITLDRAIITDEVVKNLLNIVFHIAIFQILVWASYRVATFTITYFESTIMREIYDDCFDYLHKHSYNFFSSSFAGALVRKVTKLVRSFETIFDKYYWALYPIFLRIIFSSIVLFTINHSIGLIFSTWAILFMAINYLAMLYKLPYDIARSESDTKVSAFLADTITNNINIKLFSAQCLEHEGFKDVSLENQIKTKKEWDISVVIESVQAAFMVALEILILYCAVKLWYGGKLTVGDIVLIQTYSFQLMGRLWDFGRNLKDIYAALADSQDMIEILYKPHEIKDIVGAKDLKITKGEIDFHNVDFSYNDSQKVFKNFSLKIKAGEKVAIIGHSGGGKTSLVKLIFRFFDINKGTIKIDNQDIANVKQESLRFNLSLVPQEPILFHRTLMENIRYAKPHASDREVFEASKLAYADEFIQKLPYKYDTYVGERGIKLSGGERQRVAIARAILKSAPIIILDEATSSLDSKSEKLIQKALKALFENKTAIVIAHRLSTIMGMDRIIVIEDGKIKEDGNHKTLLDKKGLYYELWNTQVGGFISS